MERRFISYLHSLLGKKVSKKHIKEEIRRHSLVSKRLISISFMPLLSITVYFYVYSASLLMDVLFLALAILYISAFMPDIFYLAWKAVRNDKTYIPSEKRIYSHRTIGLIIYSITIHLLFFLFIGLWKASIVALFAFIGYWVHINTDRVELAIDKIRNIIQDP